MVKIRMKIIGIIKKKITRNLSNMAHLSYVFGINIDSKYLSENLQLITFFKSQKPCLSSSLHRAVEKVLAIMTNYTCNRAKTVLEFSPKSYFSLNTHNSYELHCICI